ncbi:membrane protein insertase YidC [Brucepastera parasyntrophica]|uniref:membrane protein insertase YidC n=1 Tax=Brucepastera parasyntrophica TaxID=2880008 RepID=UPI00210E247A|nr:membrane protein insertase YidC [Brucepastera parasyntrophica]ULQ59926.1 membrane protein insertase YidC [Brucepastera parasyntrophica]
MIVFDIIIYPIKLIIEIIYMIFIWVFNSNVGIAIAGVSITVNLFCLPLYTKAEALQKKERDIQSKLAKRVASIKKCFKGDEQYMILSMYYRENHYHPIMALRSSISILIQVPFFIAAYSFLSHLDGLQGKPLFFINDLSMPDALFSVGGFSINILPILMTVINLIAGVVYSRGFPFKDKIQLYLMSLLFLVILYNSPSALVLYWTLNNIFSLVKNILMKLKNPGKIVYILGCTLLAVFMIYVLFIRYNAPKRALRNKTLAVLVFFLYAGIPLYIRFAKYIAKKWFSSVTDNKTFRTVFFLSCAGLWILLGMVIPFNLVASDPQEFALISSSGSPFSLLVNPAFQALGLCVFWPVYLYFLFSGRAKKIMGILFPALAFCAFLNFFFFQGNYGTISSMLEFKNTRSLNTGIAPQLINIGVCFAVFVLVFLSIKTGKIKPLPVLLALCIASSAVLIGSKTIHINSVLKTTPAEQTASGKSRDPDSLETVFTLSRNGNNVFVIMLDGAVGSYFPLFLEKNPEYRDAFDGFTYYPNTASFFHNTIFGTPPIWGGYEYSPYELNKRNTEKMVDKHNEALLVLPELFMRNDYSIMLTNMPLVNYTWIMDPDFFIARGMQAKNIMGSYTSYYARNVLGVSEYVQDIQTEDALQRNLLVFSVLLTSPFSLRDFIYQDGKYWSSEDFSEGKNVPVKTLDSYAALYYLPEITGFSDSGDTFTMMVNELTHEPAFLQYPGYTVEEETTDKGPDFFSNTRSFKSYHVNTASYILLVKWFDYLRENNVWDNTRIIIVSDHGETQITNPHFSSFQNNHVLPYNPILLFKDFAGKGEITEDNTFMTNGDVPLLAVSDLFSDPVNPFTGKDLKAEKNSGIYLFTEGYSNPSYYQGATCLEPNSKFYHLQDSIFERENWKEVLYRDFRDKITE